MRLPVINPSSITDENVREWYKIRTDIRPEQWLVPPPTILQLEVTKNCNFECIMCHKGQAIAKGGDFTRDDLSQIALEQLRALFPYLKLAILFGDGEPMLYRYFWEVVNDIRAASPDCAIDFINNGSLMHSLNRKKLFDFQVSHIGLSMGGARAESHNFARPPGMFDKIVGYYTDLFREKQERKTLEPYVTILMVVMQCNYKEIPMLVELAHSMGIYSIELQKLFVTDPMVETQVVADDQLFGYLYDGYCLALKYGIGFRHYPIANKASFYARPLNLNPQDRIFRQQYTPVDDGGYCKYQQPWNTVYVLHDGRVVPDCHWWSSSKSSHLNDCGILDERHGIFDIWNGYRYQEIRRHIINKKILPQCRGCGLAGGVVEKYRCVDTDHVSP